MRYQYAAELIEDLKRSLISPDEDFVRRNIKDTGGVTRNFTDEEITRIRGLGRDGEAAYGGDGQRGEDTSREVLRQDTEPMKKKTKHGDGAKETAAKNSAKTAPKKDTKKAAPPDKNKRSKK